MYTVSDESNTYTIIQVYCAVPPSPPSPPLSPSPPLPLPFPCSSFFSHAMHVKLVHRCVKVEGLGFLLVIQTLSIMCVCVSSIIHGHVPFPLLSSH